MTHQANYLEALLNTLPDSFILIKQDGTCLDFRPAKQPFEAYTTSPKAKHLHELGFSSDFIDSVIIALQNAPSKTTSTLECQLDNAFFAGHYELYLAYVHPSDDSSVPDILIILRDVSTQKTMQAQVEKLSFYDSLTGLPNKNFLETRFNQAQTALGQQSVGTAILYFSIDQFIDLTELSGRQLGDSLLMHVAERVRDAVRTRSVVAKLSDDHFAILLTDSNEETTARIAERILTVIREPIVIDKHRFDLSASLGIYLCSTSQLSFGEIMRCAELSMNRAKKEGNQIHFYDPEADLRLQTRAVIKRELKKALREESLNLHFQPIVHLDTGELVAAEALLRWQHPELGFVSPATFIPIAEESGLIVELDRWVVQEAICEAKRSNLTVSVNASPISLEQIAFFQHVKNCLKATQLEPSCLYIEITEQVMAKPELTLATVTALHDEGIRIAVDDFGTGYSSLIYLSQYPIDILKVDRNFVSALHDDVKTQKIARSIIRLAQSLDLIVLAEGIETEAQLDWLSLEGCELAQGYFLGRPMPVEQLMNSMPSLESSTQVAH